MIRNRGVDDLWCTVETGKRAHLTHRAGDTCIRSPRGDDDRALGIMRFPVYRYLPPVLETFPVPLHRLHFVL